MLACQSKETCLLERFRAMRLSYYEAYLSPCADCMEGTARQMDGFTPDNTWGPNCVQCGEKLGNSAPRPGGHKVAGKHYTSTGLCLACSRRGHTNSGNRAKRNTPAYWGYRAVAHKIATRRKAA